MPVTNIHDAKSNLSKLIAAAERGEEVVIARAGKPVVKIVPCGPKMASETPRRQLFGAWKDVMKAPSDDALEQMDREIQKSFEDGEIFPK
jgi:prevent-host-death family protein